MEGKRKGKRAASWYEEHPGGQAFTVPAQLLSHPNFVRLSAWACKLLFDLGRQYVPVRNGYLHPGIGLLQSQGWATRRTLFLAVRELLHYGLLLQTVQGGKNKPAYYMFTFKPYGKEKAERPWGIPVPLDSKPPHHLWQAEVDSFAPPPLAGRKKSLVLRKNKLSSSRKQVASPFVLPENKQPKACSSGEQVSAVSAGSFVLAENSNTYTQAGAASCVEGDHR